MERILPADAVERLERHVDGVAVGEPEAPAAGHPGDPADPPRRAAVAAVLRVRGGDPDVLLMRRAHHERDPWSGHISFPGGSHESADPDLRATAVRETQEELGLDLDTSARLVTRLAPLPAVAGGRIVPMEITPYVFVQHTDVELVLGAEAREAFWLPLGLAASGALDTEHEWRRDRVVRRLPAWEYEGRVVWGLTFRMLGQLLDVVRAD